MLGYGTGFGNSPDEKGLDFVVWPGIKAGPKAPGVGGGLGSDALISQVHSEGGIGHISPTGSRTVSSRFDGSAEPGDVGRLRRELRV
jgi:hypothetical protein